MGFLTRRKISFVTKVAALEQRIRSTTMLWMPEESSGEQALRMKHKMQEKLGKARYQFEGLNCALLPWSAPQQCLQLRLSAFGAAWPEQGKKTHNQDQSAYLLNQKIVTRPLIRSMASRRRLWLKLSVSSTCELRCEPWV
jgi:hypothetical protein